MKTTIVIAGTRLWPIRWRFVVVGTIRGLFHLSWCYIGVLSLMSMSVHSVPLAAMDQWRILDVLDYMQMTPYERRMLPLLVVVLFSVQRLYDFVAIFSPEVRVRRVDRQGARVSD